MKGALGVFLMWAGSTLWIVGRSNPLLTVHGWVFVGIGFLLVTLWWMDGRHDG